MESGYVSEELTVIWLLLITIVVAEYFIHSYRIKILPPSSSALLLGVFFGILSRAIGLSQTLRFSPDIFFYALLPPIVFAAGFTLKKRSFFNNIGAILTYAVVGTFISAIIFGLGTYLLVLLHVVRPASLSSNPLKDCLLYGAAISSIDPVATLAVLAQSKAPPILYNLVFGESVLNDAVAIVLFRSIEASAGSFGIVSLLKIMFQFFFLLFGSLIVGTVVTLACAFLLKRFDQYHCGPSLTGDGSIAQTIDPTIYEISIIVMGSYLAYLAAEAVGMSGIVSLFFSGICHSHYSYYNVTRDTQVAVVRVFEVAAFLCELFVFAYLGLQVVTMTHEFDFGLVFSGIPLAVASRAANIIPCTKLINHYRNRLLPANMQKMLWAVGLRGAVAYGLVVNMPGKQEAEELGIPAIETATLLIAVSSSLILGSATGPLLKILDLEGKTDEEIYRKGWEESVGGSQTSEVSYELDVGRSEFHKRFKDFDDRHLKPLFGGRIEHDERNQRIDDERETLLATENRSDAIFHQRSPSFEAS